MLEVREVIHVIAHRDSGEATCEVLLALAPLDEVRDGCHPLLGVSLQ
jgi:hypothetical protein